MEERSARQERLEEEELEERGMMEENRDAEGGDASIQTLLTFNPFFAVESKPA